MWPQKRCVYDGGSSRRARRRRGSHPLRSITKKCAHDDVHERCLGILHVALRIRPKQWPVPYIGVGEGTIAVMGTGSALSNGDEASGSAILAPILTTLVEELRKCTAKGRCRNIVHAAATVEVSCVKGKFVARCYPKQDPRLPRLLPIYSNCRNVSRLTLHSVNAPAK